jgi:hypothetical protein
MDRSPDSRQAFLTADCNAGMIEQVKYFKPTRETFTAAGYRMRIK